MVNGDAAPTTALWSRRDDVVLANPLGRPILGFAPVAEESARVAAMFVGGEIPEFEEVARWSSDDLGYVVAIEHAQVQRAGRGPRSRSRGVRYRTRSRLSGNAVVCSHNFEDQPASTSAP